jgi:hypothetical protein
METVEVTGWSTLPADDVVRALPGSVISAFVGPLGPGPTPLVELFRFGRESPDGNVVCENCVNGVVTAGAELIPFGDVDTSSIAFEVSFVTDLRALRAPE